MAQNDPLVFYYDLFEGQGPNSIHVEPLSPSIIKDEPYAIDEHYTTTKLIFGNDQNFCLRSLNHCQRSNAIVFSLLLLMGVALDLLQRFSNLRRQFL